MKDTFAHKIILFKDIKVASNNMPRVTVLEYIEETHSV